MSRFNKKHFPVFKAQFCYTPTFKTLSASDSFPFLANTNNKKYRSTDFSTFSHILSSGTAGFRVVHFLVLSEPQCCFTKWASYLTTLTKIYRNSCSSRVLTMLLSFILVGGFHLPFSESQICWPSVCLLGNANLLPLLTRTDLLLSSLSFTFIS